MRGSAVEKIENEVHLLLDERAQGGVGAKKPRPLRIITL
jgi:hypothetical protein